MHRLYHYEKWIEAVACNEKVKGIFSMLDEQFVIFDFSPWGLPKLTPKDKTQRVLTTRASFVYEPERPAEFGEYWDWMCRVQHERYEWFQTDLLAVRRDLLSLALVGRLSSLAKDHCENSMESDGANSCVLKTLLIDNNDIFSKDPREADIVMLGLSRNRMALTYVRVYSLIASVLFMYCLFLFLQRGRASFGVSKHALWPSTSDDGFSYSVCINKPQKKFGVSP